MTQIKQGFSRSPDLTYVVTSVEDNGLSKDKSPSPELVSLIVQAGDLVERYEHVAYEAKELVKKIKSKAKEEGFGVFEIGLLARTVLKDKFSPNQLTYWFPMPKSNNLPDEITNRTDDVDKEPEQRSTSEPPPDAEEFIGSPEPERIKREEPLEVEDPKDLEIQFLKEQVAELQDALKKTEQFKPANKLTEEQARDMTMEAVRQAGLATPIITLTEETVFDWLGKRDNGVSCYWYPNYGIELFKTRIFTQLKNKGVTTFKRLYFEV